MSQINNEIRSRIEAFVADLTALVQKAALDAVMAALGQPAPRAAAIKPPVAKPERPAPAPAKKAPAKAAAAKPAKPAPAKKAAPAPAKKAAARPKGAKRPPGEIVKTTQRLGEYIKANPGQGIEAIGKALATPTKDLSLPIKKLLGEKKIVAKGERRATKYFPG